MPGTFTSFLSQRIAVASNLHEGKCEGTTEDAVLILSGAISAVAAEVWRGDGIDRKRITEVLTRCARNSPHPSMISVPMLWQDPDLNQTGKLKLQSRFLYHDEFRILVDVDVDRREDEIHDLIPEIELKTLRKYSYANLFYRELRSGIVHQYRATPRAELTPMTRRESAVSYVNANSSRRIVFHFGWLTETFRSVAESLDVMFETLPLPLPAKWWIDG